MCDFLLFFKLSMNFQELSELVFRCLPLQDSTWMFGIKIHNHARLIEVYCVQLKKTKAKKLSLHAWTITVQVGQHLISK